MNDQLAASYAHCRTTCRRAASNFAWAFWLLPPDQRRGIEALYALARESDDLADSSQSPDEKRRSLATWRSDLEAAFGGGQPRGPLWPALAHTVQRFQLPPDYLRQIVLGVEMDLDHHGFETYADLRHYCQHVASAVGLACLAIWGCRDERATSPAIDCGLAFQLTNILRDLKEDAALGRCYLPREDLARFGCETVTLSNGTIDDRWLALLRFEIDRAEQLYDASAVTADYLTGPGRRMFRLMHATYRALLAKIARQPEAVFTGRVRLSRPHKAWLAVRMLFALGGRSSR